MSRLRIDNINPAVPIIGFTGAIGSGCTFLSTRLADFYGFDHYGLSDPIHDAAREQDRDETSEVLQDIGDEMRREHGPGILVKLALEKADGKWAEEASAFEGIVIDGIRNLGEVALLREFPNFSLISVQADEETRKTRLLEAGSPFVTNDTEFEKADRRDQEEDVPHGQQVKRCNYTADIIVLNDQEQSLDRPVEVERYVRSKFDRDVSLITRRAAGEPIHDIRPTQHEKLMTAAYCESRSSSCVKRRVGAVIVREGGHIIAAGHNEVADGSQPCIDSDEGWCTRDMIQERAAAEIEYCPKCGRSITFNDVECAACETNIEAFHKRCPECGKDPEVSYICECGTDVFGTYLPGANQEAGRLLDMCRALHAEENAMLSIGKTGLPGCEPCTLYTTTFPCNLCANKIAMLGIKEVVYAEPYPMREAIEVLEAREVTITRFEGVKSQAYFRLFGD